MSGKVFVDAVEQHPTSQYSFYVIMIKDRSKNIIAQKELAKSSIDQSVSMFDTYAEYYPENEIEMLLSDFAEGYSVRPYENIWFFTRC